MWQCTLVIFFFQSAFNLGPKQRTLKMFLKVVFIKDQVNTLEKMFKVPYDEHQQFMISRHLTRFKNIYINYRLWN